MKKFTEIKPENDSDSKGDCVEKMWNRKGVKTAFIWIAVDVIALALFLLCEFDWLMLCVVASNIDRIVLPLANLPEPPGIFVFLTGMIPVGALIAYIVSLANTSAEAQNMLAMILFAALLLWNAAIISFAVLEKKKSS